MADTIASIDAEIDAVRAELTRRMGARIAPTPLAYTAAWEKHPDLWRREHDLFIKRDALRYPAAS